MARNGPNLRLICPLLVLLALSSSFTVWAGNSPRPISDREVQEMKSQCYEDIENGLWGWQCKASAIAKENCALRCLSPTCYDFIYEGDPLEEGEVDYTRGREFKFCMHRLSLGENLEGVKGAFDDF